MNSTEIANSIANNSLLIGLIVITIFCAFYFNKQIIKFLNNFQSKINDMVNKRKEKREDVGTERLQ